MQIENEKIKMKKINKMNHTKIHFISIDVKENAKLIELLSNAIVKISNKLNNSVNNSNEKIIEIYYTIQFKSLIEHVLNIIQHQSQYSKLNKGIKLKKLAHSKISGHLVGCDFFPVSENSIFLVENIFHTIPYLHSIIYSTTQRNFKSLENHHIISPLTEDSLLVTEVDLINTTLSKIEFEEFKNSTMFSPSFYFNYYFKILAKNKSIDESKNMLKDKESNKTIIFNKIRINIFELLKTFKKDIQKQFVIFENSKNIGIIIETKKGQSNMFLAKKIKKIITEMNKEKLDKRKNVFLFLTNNINQKDMNDFNFVDFWINTACPRVVDNFVHQEKRENKEYEYSNKKINIVNANDFIIMLKYFKLI